MINKYNAIPVQIKASFWFLMCAFLQKAISFITTPIFTRLLTAAEYGQYNVFNSWMSILSVIITLNLFSGVYTRGLVKFEDENRVFSSSLQGLTLTLVICWTVIYWTFHSTWNRVFQLTTFQMLLMLLSIWCTAVFSFWSSEQRVILNYKSLVIVTVIVSIAKPLLGIIFVIHSHDKVTARILGIVLVELIAYSGFFFLQMKRGGVFFSKKFWKHALIFNIPLIPHYLSTSVLNGADRIMIQAMVGEAEAGIYSLAYSISMIMVMFHTALMQTIEPWLYMKIRDKQVEEISYVAYPAFILIAVVNLILIAFAPEAVAIFAPEEYSNAIFVIPPIALSVFFMFSYTFFAVFEFYFQKTYLITLATSAGALLNIILNYIFIKIFGYYAAGYTTLVCYIIYAACHYTFMRVICRKYLNNTQPYNPKTYLCIAGLFISLGFILLFTYRYMYLRYSILLLFFITVLKKKNLIKEQVNKLLSVRK